MDNWKHLGKLWDTTLPPNRPGRVETDLLRTCLLNANKDLAVVLGATPEYRNVLKLLGFKAIVVIEKNMSFLNRLSHLSIDFEYKVEKIKKGDGVEKHRSFLESLPHLSNDSKVEKIVEGDWLDILPTLKERCSVVVSDTTLGNVPFEKQDSLQEFMCQALKPKGILFDRVLHYREGLCSWDSINETFRFLPLNLETANLFHIMAVFRSPVIHKIRKISAMEAYDRAIGQNPDLIHIAKLTKKWVTPERCEWYYDGRFRPPLKVYKRFLKPVQEKKRKLPGFGRNISIVIGKR